MKFFSFSKPKSTLGIDIGTASIKIAEIGKEGERPKLLNYGLFELENVNEAIQSKQRISKLGDREIIWGIKESIKRAKITGRDVVASIPSYSTFATVISMPYLS